MKNTLTQRGMSLLETMMVMGVSATMLLAGIYSYNLVSNSERTSEMSTLLAQTASNIRRLYIGQQSYGSDGANITQRVTEAGSVSAKYALTPAKDAINGPFGSIVVTSRDTKFEITADELPQSTCVEVIKQINPSTKREITGVKIGTTALTNFATSDLLRNACTRVNSVTWTYR